MSNRVITVGAAILLGGCTTEGLPDYGCQNTVTSCRVVQSAFYGYERACSTTCTTYGNGGRGQGDDDDDDAKDEGKDDVAIVENNAAASTAAQPNRNLGAAPAPDMTRYSAFEGACERDSQCGPGKCVSGNCYYGCQSDAQCGSGDRCSVESGVRVCMPDPNPAVQCTRTAQCDEGHACLNGGCRQTCASTEECKNMLDRCSGGFCVPDRRPLGECVVNSECGEGLVCLDGSCVAACADQADGGACLGEPSQQQPAPEGQTPSTLPTQTPPADEGSGATPGDDTPAPPPADAPTTPASGGDGTAPAAGDEAGTDDGAAEGSGASGAEEPASNDSNEAGTSPVPLAG
jgi:hypothetical protein